MVTEYCDLFEFWMQTWNPPKDAEERHRHATDHDREGVPQVQF